MMLKKNIFRKILFSLVIFVLAVLPVKVFAQAEGDVGPVVFRYNRLATIIPGETWTDAEGIHIRNRLDLGMLSGGVNGTTRVIYNADFTPTTITSRNLDDVQKFNGVAFGSIEVYSSQMDLIHPIWTGTWSYHIHNSRVVSGMLNAYSYNGLWLLQVNYVVESQRGSIIHEGEIAPNNICPDRGCEIDPSVLVR